MCCDRRRGLSLVLHEPKRGEDLTEVRKITGKNRFKFGGVKAAEGQPQGVDHTVQSLVRDRLLRMAATR